jgi:GTP-binding protein HflX
MVGAELPGSALWSLADSMAELAQLAVSAGLEPVAEVTQRLEAPHTATFVGKGKAQELAELRKKVPYDIVLFDDELSPSQQRNLEDIVGGQVMDRTGLILDIFAQRARTHEGRLQVELAQCEYYLPRLTRLWTHLSRQTRGGAGLRGPGETQLESDRRNIRRKVIELRRQLEGVRTHRALHRQHRRSEMVPVVALVGYTNAGKSTLLHALTGADVFVADKLFATLDPTARRLRLPHGQEVILTDTVGFIQKLPPQLVAAFRATLEELDDADVLVEVVDISHPQAAQQTQAVAETLRTLGLGDRPLVLALNKTDRLGGPAVQPDIRQAVQRSVGAYSDTAAISALTGFGLADLTDRVERVLARDQVELEIVLPYQAAEMLSMLRHRSSVVAEAFSPAGVRLTVRVPGWLAASLATYVQHS